MATHSDACPVDNPLLQVADLLRAARLCRVLSQRELAARAGLTRTTVERLQSGQTNDPSLSTVQRLLAAAGFSMMVVDDSGDELSYRNAPDTRLDRAGRRMPAHLPQVPLNEYWWGWNRIAWSYDPDPKTTYGAPDWIYFTRPRPTPIKPSRTSE